MKKIMLLALLKFFLVQRVFAFSSEQSEPISPIPLNFEVGDPKKVQLGMRLFNDPILSKNQTISCASCHLTSKGGADGLQLSVGIGGELGEINAPTVYNSGFNFKQFWNGRAKSLEEQIEGPIHNSKEMGSSWDFIIARLRTNQFYSESFRQVYKSEPTSMLVQDAIAQFERALSTPNSRFDQFLRGESKALSEIEKDGYKKFKSYGCVACHQGINIGGNMFQTMGVMGEYFKDRKSPITSADLGRYSITKKESDKFAFKVPSLRNVELTAPYFHDGSAKTLDDAVRVMAKYQLGLLLSKKEVDAFVAFLKTLTGETPKILQKEEKRVPATARSNQ